MITSDDPVNHGLMIILTGSMLVKRYAFCGQTKVESSVAERNFTLATCILPVILAATRHYL